MTLVLVKSAALTGQESDAEGPTTTNEKGASSQSLASLLGLPTKIPMAVIFIQRHMDHIGH